MNIYIIPDLWYNWNMSEIEVLNQAEAGALVGGDFESAAGGLEGDGGARGANDARGDTGFVARVAGQAMGSAGKSRKNWAAMGAVGFVTLLLLVLLLVVGSGNFIISMFSERLVEETDVQYADAVESKILVFQQALSEGAVPANTVEALKVNGVLVGFSEDGEFTEGAGGNALLIETTGEVVTAGEFSRVVHTNVTLYNALNEATYGRAAYYYDESAMAVFNEIGTKRNNFDESMDFEETMDALMGAGSDIDVNSVVRVEREEGVDYELTGSAADSAGAEFVNEVREKSRGANETEAAIAAATTLSVADTMTREERASLFYTLLMENISKTKAGEGNDAKINEVMNYLYRDTESAVVDVSTGEVVTVKGSMLESPSLYAILSGEPVVATEVENYSNERVLRTVENLVATDAGAGVFGETVTSAGSRMAQGSIGRYVFDGSAVGSSGVMGAVTPTVTASLVENSFDTLDGVSGGEFLVEGAVSVGRRLALASGATAGDAAAVKAYGRVTEAVLALDAEAERMSRSPLDVTSRHTFLGSIVYSMAVSSTRAGSVMGVLANVGRTMGNMVAGLWPAAAAEDDNTGYLTNFGECERAGSIGAVATVGCSDIVTFDTATLNDPWGDAGFVAFVEANTTLGADGVRTVNRGSDLEKFIIYNDEKKTLNGLTDGGILQSLSVGSVRIPFVSDILAMVKAWLSADDADKRVASGAEFVNTASNDNWDATWRYAQRYVSLARAAAMLRQYDGDVAAYSSLRYFEGYENPVVAVVREYWAGVGE